MKVVYIQLYFLCRNPSEPKRPKLENDTSKVSGPSLLVYVFNLHCNESSSFCLCIDVCVSVHVYAGSSLQDSYCSRSDRHRLCCGDIKAERPGTYKSM